MTKCDLPDTDLIAYIDGELHGARREYVEIHLRVCPSCQTRLEEIHDTTRLLQRATPLADDPDGRTRLKARLAVEAQRAPRHTPRLPILIALPALILIIATIASVTWTTSPTEAAVSLRALIRRADPNAAPPPPSTVLTEDRLPGKPSLPAASTGIEQATFPTVVLPRLTGDLTLTSFTLTRPDYAELRYAGPNQLVISLAERPANKSNSTAEDSEKLVVIANTEVLWQINPKAQAFIVHAIWVRNDIEFNLLLLQAAGPGIPIPVAQQIIQQIITAQGNANG